MGWRPVSQKVTAQVALSLLSFRERQSSIGLPWSEKVTVPLGAAAPAGGVRAETVAVIVVRRPWRISLGRRRPTEVWVAPAAGAWCGVAATAMATPTAIARPVATKKRSARLRGELVACVPLLRRGKPAKPRVLESSDRRMTTHD